MCLEWQISKGWIIHSKKYGNDASFNGGSVSVVERDYGGATQLILHTNFEVLGQFDGLLMSRPPSNTKGCNTGNRLRAVQHILIKFRKNILQYHGKNTVGDPPILNPGNTEHIQLVI